jgi:tight adherence protein B
MIFSSALVLAAVLVAAYSVVLGMEERRRRLSDQLTYVRSGRLSAPAPKRQAPRKRASLTRPARAAEPLPWPFSGLDALQQQAGENEGPLRLIMTAVIAATACAVVGWLLTGSPAITFGGAFGGLSAPIILLRRRAAKRTAEIEDQVSAVCLRLAQTLGAGMPVERALQEVARQAPSPLGDELRAVISDSEIHAVPLESALASLVTRIPQAPTLRMLVAAIQVSLEMGADLADQLDRLADVIQQRRLAISRIASVTATARTQAKILAFVPLAAYVWIHTLSPQTLAGYATPGGQVRLLLIGGWVVLGYMVSQGIISSLIGRVG